MFQVEVLRQAQQLTAAHAGLDDKSNHRMKISRLAPVSGSARSLFLVAFYSPRAALRR
ncbi:hypothetical protein MMB17_15005 [Methylobacterium organophilum]|uniref:hypothetical protein n=1 Tax=Methylobacterium organophilum TaxID=410 RepID=UPI001F13F04C|nr:hypothetical protein [Methylobacterium organophilum]UMY16030.1 hypothetical protein MMB17_15005 [Methylobacterium organophilum]